MDTDACKIWSVAEFFGSYGKTLQKPEYQRVGRTLKVPPKRTLI